MTTDPTSYASPTLDRLHGRLAQMRDQAGFALLDTDSFDAFCAETGDALILFAEDPMKVPETWDMTIILPEVVKTLSPSNPPLRVGMLPPAAARALAGRYGIRLWPALLALRHGEYLGAIEGLKDWTVYKSQVPALLAATPSRPPSIGIPVQTIGAANSAACH
jgi:hydrogenase-1 operon protein HyaE